LPLSEPSIPWRTPSVQLLVDGRPVAGVIQAEVIANNHYAADSFRSILALGADPTATAAFWAGTGSVLVDLRFSLDQSGYVSLIQGEIDSIAIDPAGGTVELDGRDLTARLIEARTQETFSNRTASEIATLLAQRHGLTPVVTATNTPVGRYYQNEHDRITLDQFGHATTEWELLVFLARQEGYDLFVQGTSLYFQPPGGTVARAFVLQPDALIGLRLHRSLTLAKDIEVTVKSWNSRQKNAFTQTARAHGTMSPTGGDGIPASVQQYVYVRPNLTPDQALQFAQARLTELALHERVIDVVMPGELAITPRSTILLDGTGTAFDQSYAIDVIEREIRLDGGFVQRVRAKNTSPRTQTTAPADTVGAVTG